MKFILLNKYKKKIKVIRNYNNFQIIGPLGILNYNFVDKLNTSLFLDKEIFLDKKLKIFFLNKIRMLFRSVSTGWFKELKFKGIGFKCFKMEEKLAFDLGYSTLITYKPCPTIKVRNLKNKVVLFSIYKEHLNNIGTFIKNFGKPDVYKGKGIWFKNEFLKLKKKLNYN